MSEQKDSNEKGSEQEEEKQNISVKGVRKDLYSKVLKLTRDTGQTLGEITNEAYRTMLAGMEGAKHLSKNFIEGATKSNVKYIENIRNLTITGRDLKEITARVSFKNMDTLVFEDITTEDIEKHIDSISNVKIVKIPSSVSKASILLRSTYVDEVQTVG